MKGRIKLVAAVILLTLFLMPGCGGKSDLSRSKAKKLIESSDKFVKFQVSFQPAGGMAQTGVAQGLWKPQQLGFMSFYALTPKGETYFTNMGGGNVQLKQELRRRVTEVTGITDAPATMGAAGTVKDVQFTWDCDGDNLPPDVKSVLLPPGHPPGPAEAVLKLYDDGWRLEDWHAN